MTSLEYIQRLTKDIVPSMAYKYDVDFETWKKEAYDKLVELLGLPLIDCDLDFRILKEEDCNIHKRITFEFQSEPGYYVPCTMLVPNTVKKPTPGVICLQGHSSGAHISLGIPKFSGDEQEISGGRPIALLAVKEGYCSIAMEQRYMGVKGQIENGEPACLRKNASMSSLLIGRTAIGERVWDIHKLLDVIEKYLTAYIDTTRIMCTGGSGGGTATFYAACYDERISLVAPTCAVCSFDDSIIAMKHCECNYIPNIRKYFDMGDIGCLIAPRPLLVVCGIHDPIFPVQGVEKSFATIKKAYEHLGKGEMCHLLKGDGVHQQFPELLWPMTKRFI